MNLNKIFLLIFSFFFLKQYCLAENFLRGGRPQLNFEFEKEKDSLDSSDGNSIAVYPGIRWEKGYINILELRYSYEREIENSNKLVVYENNKDFGIRIKKNFSISENFGGFFRVLVGRQVNQSISYNFGYIEPAFTYNINAFKNIKPFEFYVGYRIIKSIDGTKNRDYDLFRLGPGWEINDKLDVEFRYTNGFDNLNKQKIKQSVELEITIKF
tara:strand:- start:891 stop:1529 length:639 start_codon:yes stop_codon:yes gene_type:complete